MIASLPMYDRPETVAANDRFWNLIRKHLPFPAPIALNRDVVDLLDHWQSHDLLLSQTCGFPFRAKLVGKVNLVATPILNIDCPIGHYYSVIVAHRDSDQKPLVQLDGATAAINDSMSQSGWAAVYAHFKKYGISVGSTIETGSHRASAIAVAERRAEFAAIDALTWQMICKWDDFAEKLCVIGQTSPTPTLPYICSLDVDQHALFSALEQAVYDLSDHDKSILGVRGITRIPDGAYQAVSNPPTIRK